MIVPYIKKSAKGLNHDGWIENDLLPSEIQSEKENRPLRAGDDTMELRR
jgi:hypothetical protein